MRGINKYTAVLLYSLISMSGALAQDTLSTEAVMRQHLQKPFFTLNMFVQVDAGISLLENGSVEAYSFRARTARLSFSGIIDSGFYYRIFFDVAPEPVLLDAFIGYRFSELYRIQAGAMKPNQSLDYIPKPVDHHFTSRAEITRLLLASRELGIAAEGNWRQWEYYLGGFNGLGFNTGNNRHVYWIGRVQYNMTEAFQSAVSASHGNSPGRVSGSIGPMLRGTRTLYGADLQYEDGHLYFAAEYQQGKLETEAFPEDKEIIAGMYFTGGVRWSESVMLYTRWQQWNYTLQAKTESAITWGIYTHLTPLFSLKLNIDAYMPYRSANRYGLSASLQMKF